MTAPAGPEPLEPHESGAPGLLSCRRCGGVTTSGHLDVLAHHLPGCPWRIARETERATERADPQAGLLAAAQVEASLLHNRNGHLERQLAAVTARLACFEIRGSHLVYVHHAGAPHDGEGPCSVKIACPQALRALEALLGNQVAARSGSETAAPAPYQPTAAPAAAGRAGAAPQDAEH